MAAPKNSAYFYKNLTSGDYSKIAKSAQSENITQIANWLPERINKIHELYTQASKNGMPRVYVSEEIWNELKKAHERSGHSHSFLAQPSKGGVDEHYRDCCSQLGKTITLLEMILEEEINKSEKLFNRRKPQECLIKQINNQADYLQLIALTLKEVYQQYPDQEGILFPNKKDLAPFIENVNPEIETSHRYVRGQ